MGNLCNFVDIGDIAVGVAERLKEYGLCVGLDGSLNLCEVVYVNKCRIYTVKLERMSQKVI